jgi:CelD/BcsL family acetyltransferase involved in cellulose biosynthesis
MSAAAARWLDRVPAGWDALVAADPSSSPSHRPAVWEAFAAALPGHEPRVLALEEGGELVGGVPAIELRRGPFRWLHALPLLLPAPPLARPGRHVAIDPAAAAAFAELARERRVVGGAWSWYRPGGATPDPRVLALVPGETRLVEASVVELGAGLEAALARVGRKERAALRRPRTAFVFSDDPGELETAYALHAAQSSRWGGHRPLPLDLSRRLLAAGGEPAVARLFSLRDGRGLVSAALALDGPHETFLWWSGTHPDGRTLGAFTLLLWRVVEWAAARGRTRVNLGASSSLPGVASFKRSLGVEPLRYPVRWLDASSANAAGRAVAALQARAWRGRARGEVGA